MVMYRAPKIEVLQKKAYEIPFVQTVGATSQLTLISSLIPFLFKVIIVKIYFSANHANAVGHYILIGRNNQGSTTGIPEGENVLGPYVPLSPLVGDNETIVLQPNYVWPELKGYVKVHVNNARPYTVQIKVLVTIQER